MSDNKCCCEQPNPFFRIIVIIFTIIVIVTVALVFFAKPLDTTPSSETKAVENAAAVQAE